MASKDGGGQSQISMRVQEGAEPALLFDAQDGVTIRVAFDTQTHVRVEMWRDADGIIVPPDVGNIGSKAFRERLLGAARERFNPPPGKDKKSGDTVPHLEDDLGKVATAMGVPGIADMLKPEAGTTIVERLVECAEESGTLFQTPDGKPHVSLSIDGHTETYEVSETQFRIWLRGYFYAKEQESLKNQAIAAQEQAIEKLGALYPGGDKGEVRVPKPPVVRDQAIADAIAQLKSMALFEKRVATVYLRIGISEEGKIYLDLGNEKWDAVEVDADGWRVVENPPVRFVRAKGMQALPYPEPGGSVEALWDVLTLSRERENDRDSMRLILAWLVQALRPDRGSYPILVLRGGQGTGKTTNTRLIRRIVDPSAVTDIRKPRSEEEIHIDAACSWVIALDNISGVQQWLSDVICRISTGSAMTKRTLYSDRDREIFLARQPQVLNGISDVATRGDLLRRSLLIDLPLVEENAEEEQIYEQLEERHPGILGALLDAVSAGLKSIQDGEVISERLPDMADFSKWAIRTEVALGGERGDFMRAYERSRQDASDTVLEAEPVAMTLYEFAQSFKGEEHAWTGTNSELLAALNNAESNEAVTRSSAWPKDGADLGRKLARVKPSLSNLGVEIEEATRSNKGARKRVYSQPEEDFGEV